VIALLKPFTEIRLQAVSFTFVYLLTGFYESNFPSPPATAKQMIRLRPVPFLPDRLSLANTGAPIARKSRGAPDNI